jgi:murein L,D-transpeptidase YcbB/YkuD
VCSSDLSLDEIWINEWWRGTKIGADIYIDFEPLEFAQSAPIVGIVNTTRNTQGKSLLDLLKPYQILYNIAMNQLWELLEKEIGVVFLGDLKVVPKKDSQDPIEMMLWNAKNRGALFIDTSIENTGGAVQFNQMSRVDLTRTAEIGARIQLAQQLRAEAYELIGITRQRLGSPTASETATATREGLAQSFAQTETWFAWHDVVLQKVYQTSLDLAQYIELQKPSSTLNYLNTELETVFLKITKDELLHELFVFVTSYAEDKVTLEQMKQLAQPAMQNGAELSEMLDLFSASSERSLRKTLKEVQERKAKIQEQAQQMQQMQMQQQQQQFEQKLQADMQLKKEEAQREDINKELDRQNRLEVEKLRGIANEGS